MAELRDRQRLELLKEIGGAKQYEIRRREVLAKLRECEQRQAQIDDMVGAHPACHAATGVIVLGRHWGLKNAYSWTVVLSLATVLIHLS